jgi:hypothetical protein
MNKSFHKTTNKHNPPVKTGTLSDKPDYINTTAIKAGLQQKYNNPTLQPTNTYSKPTQQKLKQKLKEQQQKTTRQQAKQA